MTTRLLDVSDLRVAYPGAVSGPAPWRSCTGSP